MRINSDLNEVENIIARDTFGDIVTISNYKHPDYYTFPSDGYLGMYGGTDSGQSISGTIRDKNGTYIATVNCNAYNSNTIYVKKGMRYSTGGTPSSQAWAQFIPFE